MLFRAAFPVLALLAAGCTTDAMPASQTAEPLPQSTKNTTKYSCDAMGSVPVVDRCEFFKANCESESRIPYAELYYCKASRHNGFVRFLYLALVLVLLPLLFTLLGDTAEMYFSPIMAHISQTIPKMRPRFAGVTFVALGNGAPDLSSNISAIRNGNILLSAGALTGAAMFVQCIVASEVIRVSSGVRCRGAMLRDISIYTASIIGVLIFFAVGVVNRLFVLLAVAMYCLFAFWVFAGDEWHAAGRPRLSALSRHIRNTFRSRRGDELVDEFEEGLLPWADVDVGPDSPSDREMNMPLQPLTIAHPDDRVDLTSPSHPSASFALVGARAYRKAVWADLDAADGGEAEPESLAMAPMPSSRGYSGIPDYAPPPATSAAASTTGAAPRASFERAPERATSNYLELAPHFNLEDRGPGSPAPAGNLLEFRNSLTWFTLKDEFTMGQASEWLSGDGYSVVFRAVTFPLLLPVYIALRMTIPFVDPDAYNHQWLVVTTLCSPMWVLVYLEAYSMTALMVAFMVGVIGAGVVFWFVGEERELPPLMVGQVAMAPALAALAGFVVGVMWIDTFASEVVGILTFLAGLCNFPEGVVGMTVLAWGNSLGDLFGNKAMARQGHASMALTACFASPLFNMLISMALGFGSMFARTGIPWAKVELTAEVALGCVFLAVYNLAVGVVGLMNRGAIPQRFYLFARGWYGVYFVLACGCGLLSHYGWW